MGANENAWGVSPLAIEAAGFNTLKEGWKYNDPECFDLRNALAAYHNVNPEHLIFGEGIDGLLGLVVRAIVEFGSQVVMSKGSYPTFEYHVHGYGAGLVEVGYKNFKPDLIGLVHAANEADARIIYLANPDNPSGFFYNSNSILDFVNSIPEDCLIILDEAYSDYVEKEELMDEKIIANNLIRLRTFSKIYGLASVRVGYGISCREVISNLNKIRTHFGVNMIGQKMVSGSNGGCGICKNGKTTHKGGARTSV